LSVPIYRYISARQWRGVIHSNSFKQKHFSICYKNHHVLKIWKEKCKQFLNHVYSIFVISHLFSTISVIHCTTIYIMLLLQYQKRLYFKIQMANFETKSDRQILTSVFRRRACVPCFPEQHIFLIHLGALNLYWRIIIEYLLVLNNI